MAPADANTWRRARPLVIARAGGDLEAPEHTLYAARRAVAHDADALQVDLRLAGDGQVVLLADPTVERTTDGSGHVETFSLGDLKHLDAAHRFSPGRGATDEPGDQGYPLRGITPGGQPPPDGVRPDELRIPAFPELLEALPEARLVLRLHDHRRRKGVLARKAVEALERHDAIPRALVTPHNDASARILRRNAPDLDLAWPSAQLVVRGDRGMATDLHAPSYKAAHLPFEHAGRPILTEQVVGKLHATGMGLLVHGVDEIPAAERCLDLGVDGIVTGRPGLVAGTLRR